jgi:YidC/Oxa1 family membrane protein insertase
MKLAVSLPFLARVSAMPRPALARASAVGAVVVAMGLSLFACQATPAGEARLPSPVGAPSQRKTLTLESDDFVATFDADSAALAHYTLRDPRFQRDQQPIDLVTTDKPQFLPLGIKLAGQALASGWRAEQLGPKALRFTTEVGGLRLVRKIEVGGRYQLWSTLRVENLTNGAQSPKLSVEGHHYLNRTHEQGGFLAGRSPLLASGLCLADDTPKRVEREEMVEESPSVSGKVAFGSVDTVYFTQAIAGEGQPFASCALSGSDRGGTKEQPDGALLNVSLAHPPVKLAPHGQATLRTLAYLGPKTPKELAAAGHGLRRTSYVGGLPGIDSIANGLVTLLEYIQTYIGNWGLAIILLTIVVKAVLFPLTAKSFESIAAMRRVKPAIDAINEKYANEREKKGAAMMELYKEHKINPFGGCLPQLLQLPVWWALYTSLSTNVELFRRPFVGYWTDLAAPDPYYILPLALGLLMYVQQKITPSTMDPAQAKMMLYVMPIMITSFMLFLPAGLCLYMFTNSVLSIGQQRLIEYRLAHKHPTTEVASTDKANSSNDAQGGASPRRTGRGRA